MTTGEIKILHLLIYAGVAYKPTLVELLERDTLIKGSINKFLYRVGHQYYL